MLIRKHSAIIAAASLVGLAIFSGSVLATDLTANASATIVAPLSIVENTPMDFGSISADATNATNVTLDLVNTVTSADGAGVVPASGAASGDFTVSGAGNLAIAVSYTAGSLTGPGAAMAVSGFTDNAPANLTAGTATFQVGADLAVGANQTAGAYSGTYTITVIYN